MVGYAVVPNAREVGGSIVLLVLLASQFFSCATVSVRRSVIALNHLPLLTQVLSKLYTQTLSALQRLPKDAAYRHHTEQVVQQRLQVVQAETSIPIIEEKIGCGQVEELIDQVRGCGFECMCLLEVALCVCLEWATF